MEQKKIVIFGAVIVVLVGILFFIQGRQSEEKPTNNQPTVATTERTTPSEETSVASVSRENSSDSSHERDDTLEETVTNFVTNWTTYEDVYERNQSVKPYVTEAFVRDNSLDTNPNVTSVTVGTIHTIAVDVTNEKHYVVTGSQDSSGYINEYVMDLTLTDDGKIDVAEVYDLRTGY